MTIKTTRVLSSKKIIINSIKINYFYVDPKGYPREEDVTGVFDEKLVVSI